MRKSTIIASALVQSRAFTTLAEAESHVRSVFREAFPEESCSAWNEDVEPATAASLIDRAGAAHAPDVRRFIDHLRNVPPAPFS